MFVYSVSWSVLLHLFVTCLSLTLASGLDCLLLCFHFCFAVLFTCFCFAVVPKTFKRFDVMSCIADIRVDIYRVD